MTITLRPYQATMVAAVRQAWADGAQNVLMRADTGAGKTAILGYIHNEHPGASGIIAHRAELVGQLSLTLARYGLRHDLIAADATKRAIARAHAEEFGQCYYTPGARAKVVSIDTLIRADGLESWAAQVTLWTCDEAHHLTRGATGLGNKWGKGVSLFTHSACRGLMPTATPRRADGKGLGRHADGYADAMVEGPPMRWLIANNYLTDYKIVCPPTDIRQFLEIDENGEPAKPGASGDWSPKQLRKAAQRSHIIGDAVQHYCRWAHGKRTIAFCTDVETAVETAAKFNAAGIPAATLTGKTDDRLRRHIIRQLALGEIWVLCAVDIISEGFDLPAVECIIMARPTESLALFMQQFGRALRIMAGKQWAIIIDMVGNVVRLGGPPDRPRIWSLDRRDKKSTGSSGIPYRICVACFQPYERYYRECPFCGHYPEPEGRSQPRQVDGDLEELDAATLARLRGDVAAVDMSEWDYASGLNAKHARPEWITRHTNLHREQQAAQAELRAAMDRWAGPRHYHAGRSDSQIQREFYLTFGLSVLEAMALGRNDARAMTAKVDSAVSGG